MTSMRALRAVVAARAVSLTGTNMTTVALPWFVLATTGSTAKMGLVLACQSLPSVLLGVPAGAVVAAVGARRFLVLADAMRAPLLALVPLLHALGWLSFPALLAVVAVIGVFAVPYSAAATSLLPQLVGEDQRALTRATAALQVAIQATGVVGPVLAGVLIAPFGASNVLYLDAASYAVSAAVVLGFVPAAARAAPSTARRSGLLVGVRALFADRLLRAILITTLVAHVALAALFASLPAFAFQHFHDPKLGGILFAADATGSVLGGLLTMRLARRTQPMALGIVGFALMAAPLLLAFGAARPLAVATLFVFGIGGPLGIAPVSAVLTSRCTPALRPQTVSAFLALSNAGTPLGSGGAGWVITRTGLGPVFAGVGGAMATAALLLARAARQDVPTQQAQPPTGHTQAAPTG